MEQIRTTCQQSANGCIHSRKEDFWEKQNVLTAVNPGNNNICFAICMQWLSSQHSLSLFSLFGTKETNSTRFCTSSGSTLFIFKWKNEEIQMHFAVFMINIYGKQLTTLEMCQKREIHTHKLHRSRIKWKRIHFTLWHRRSDAKRVNKFGRVEPGRLSQRSMERHYNL